MRRFDSVYNALEILEKMLYTKDEVRILVYEYTCDAWGNFLTGYSNGGANTTATKNPFRYRGYYYDKDLGLYYLQSRYYDAVTGRFISPDTIGYLGANGDLNSYNLYAYCSNNPVLYTDPTGHSPILLAALIGFAVGLVATLVADALDDGEALNGSISAADYIENGVVSAGVAIIATVAPTIISNVIPSSCPAVVNGVAVVSAEAGIATTLVSGVLLFAKASKRSDKEKADDAKCQNIFTYSTLSYCNLLFNMLKYYM